MPKITKGSLIQKSIRYEITSWPHHSRCSKPKLWTDKSNNRQKMYTINLEQILYSYMLPLTKPIIDKTPSRKQNMEHQIAKSIQLSSLFEVNHYKTCCNWINRRQNFPRKTRVEEQRDIPLRSKIGFHGKNSNWDRWNQQENIFWKFSIFIYTKTISSER